MEEEWYNQSNEDNLREQLQELESKVLEFKKVLRKYKGEYWNPKELITEYNKHFGING